MTSKLQAKITQCVLLWCITRLSLTPRCIDTSPFHTFVHHGTAPRHTASLLSPRPAPFLRFSAPRTIEGEEGGVVNAVRYENSCRSNESDADVVVSIPGDSRPSTCGVRRIAEATVERCFLETGALCPSSAFAASFGSD